MSVSVRPEDVTCLTVEEAAAKLLSVDYIPPGFSLLSLLEAFREEAEVERDNARSDSLSAVVLNQAQCRLDACTSRRNLAELMIELLRNEIELNPRSPLAVRDSTESVMIRLTSLVDWAEDRYGISLSLSKPTSMDSDQSPVGQKSWSDLTVKLRANNRIAYSFGGGKWHEKGLADVGLLHRKRNQPNHQAVILIGLAHGMRLPADGRGSPQRKEAKAISLLRKSLVALTGLKHGDPIIFNSADGYRPAFVLIDDRGNADKRARERAQTVPLFDDRPDAHGSDSWPGSDFEHEDDLAGTWLENQLGLVTGNQT